MDGQSTHTQQEFLVTHQDLIGAAMAVDLTLPVNYLVSREGMDRVEAERTAVEYRRYLAINAMFPGQKFPISTPVDRIWHTHLLFTVPYHDMSTQLFGGYFHHLPTTSENERKALEPQYFEGTLARYEELFGTPSEEYWPKESGAICWSCSGAPRPPTN